MTEAITGVCLGVGAAAVGLTALALLCTKLCPVCDHIFTQDVKCCPYCLTEF